MITLHTAGVTLENKISSNRMTETVSLSKFISTYSFQHDCTCMNESVDYRPLCLMKIRMQDDQNPPIGRADSTGGMNCGRTTRFGGEPQGKAANYVNKLNCKINSTNRGTFSNSVRKIILMVSMVQGV